jgi:hypothetical protein
MKSTRTIIAAVLALSAGPARAQDPPPVVPPPEAATSPPPSATTPPASADAPAAVTVTRLPRPIASPLHPRRRMMRGSTIGAGVYCPDLSTPLLSYGRWCTPQLHLGLDGPFADVHVSLLFGDVLRYGALIGFEIGTPYIQLGSKRQRGALALRGNFDLLIAGLGQPIPGRYDDGVLGFSNTYGPHFSIAVSPRASLELRGAVGWTVAGFFAHNEGWNRPQYGLVFESWLGLRMSP